MSCGNPFNHLLQDAKESMNPSKSPGMMKKSNVCFMGFVLNLDQVQDK